MSRYFHVFYWLQFQELDLNEELDMSLLRNVMNSFECNLTQVRNLGSWIRVLNFLYSPHKEIGPLEFIQP